MNEVNTVPQLKQALTRTSYVVFELGRALYATETAHVREFIALPELTLIPSAPYCIVGTLNLRGELIPVMDLNLRQGFSGARYVLDDNVVVIEHEGASLGLVANEIRGVQVIVRDAIEVAPYLADATTAVFGIGVGMAAVGQDVVTVLDPERLLQLTPSVAALDTEEGIDSESGARHEFFCPEATEEERSGFQARARRLRRVVIDQTATRPLTVVVIGLHEQRYGIEAGQVLELTNVGPITPMPCCPSHIVGIVNLRGEILTLVDMSLALNLPPVELGPASKIVVVKANGTPLGLLVDGVFDIVSLDEEKLSEAPAATRANPYLKGTTLYAEQVLSVLDVANVVTQADLEVNEQV